MNPMTLIFLALAGLLFYIAVTNRYQQLWAALKSLPLTPASLGSEAPGDNLPPDPSGTPPPGGHLKG